MAKGESFFIRGTVTPSNTNAFVQTTIDLSAYVSALGKSILKIHSIEGEWAQSPTGDIPNGSPVMTGNEASEAVWQLTTQSNTGLVGLDDRTTVAKGQIWARNSDSAANSPGEVYIDSHMPQHYSDGFLIAVEDLYLGARAGTSWVAGSELTYNIVLECSVQTMNASAAMALSLSQQ